MRPRPVAAVALVATLFSPLPTAAGPSCVERAADHPGGWIAGTPAGGSGGPVTARNRAAVDRVLSSLEGQVRAAYPEPVGSQGKAYRNYGLEPFAGDALASYELVANFKGYGCDRRANPEGELSQYSETATWLYLQVNGFWPGNTGFEYPQFFLSPQDHEGLVSIRPRRVLRAPAPGSPDRRPIDATLPAAFDAYPTFTFEQEYDSTDYSYNRREVSQIVFVTPDRQLPYDPVSIGEFLDLNERRLTAYIRDNEAYGPMDSYRGLLGRIPELRARFAGRLGQPAYIRSFSWSESELAAAEPFADPATGHLLARRSARYNGPGDPARPRFLAVVWRWQPEAPYSVRAHEAIKNGLDLAALDALLLR